MRRSLASGGRRREEEEESGTEGDPETGRGGGGKERRREGEGEEGKGESRRRDGDRDLGAERGVATALSEDNREREGGAGRGPRGGASLQRPRVGLGSRLPFSRRNPWPSISVPMDHAPLPLGSLGEPRCPDPRPELADPRQPPVTQVPRGTWRGSSSCYSRARPSHLLPLLPTLLPPPASLCYRGVRGGHQAVVGP